MVNTKQRSIIAWMFKGLVKCIWFTIIYIIFPKVKWIIAMDVVFQGCRAIYYWNDPAMNAGWTFLMHFGVLTTLIFFYQYYAINPLER